MMMHFEEFLFCSDTLTPVIGEHLKQQVEDRLKFYETGDAPKKNLEVMQEAIVEVIRMVSYRCLDHRGDDLNGLRRHK